jgi:hypothetical protein
MHRFLVLVIAVLVVAFAPGRAAAHDLRAKVKTVVDPIVVEVGFDDDTPAEGAKVVIYDSSGKEIAAGKTDEKGVWTFKKPAPGKYKAVVESAGHRDEVEFPIEAAELLDSPVEYARERPNQTAGLIGGVAVLLAASGGYWWFRRRRAV